ncbi:MAG: GNAT family N-acetyltransferase [Clostridia bacterium]|nr:GNAT family N-acetyltransferase [Clostridia bacterium]
MKSVEIREWKLSDADDLAKALSNLNVLNNLRDGIPYPYTENDAKDYIQAMLAEDKNNVFAFAICYDGKVIGSIGAFRQGNVHFRTAELGYYIAEEYWGKGIGTQAVRLLCDYVFANTDILRIFAEPFAHNAASCRVLVKAGFEYEGTLRSNAVKCGNICDMKMYSIIKK